MPPNTPTPHSPLPPFLFYLSFCVAEYNSLRDCEGVVQVTQSVELPLLPLHCHEKLFDALIGGTRGAGVGGMGLGVRMGRGNRDGDGTTVSHAGLRADRLN